MLLILAAISLTMLTGDNSILKRAVEAKEETEKAQIIEEVQMDIMATLSAKLSDELTEGELESLLTPKYGTLSTDEDRILDKTLRTKDGKYYIPVSKIYNGKLKVEIGKKVTNPYEGKQWEKAWVCNSGVWNDTAIEAGSSAEGDVVAKLYKTGKRITPSDKDIEQQFSEGNEYHLVFEGEGKIGDLEAVAVGEDNLKGKVAYQSNSVYAQQEAILMAMIGGQEYSLEMDLTENGALTSYITGVTICDGITEIGEYAFLNFISLSNIELPDSLTKIGSMAFNTCSNLTNITIPDSVKQIEEFAFFNCMNLTSVVIPNGITRIEKSVFKSCENLTSVIIPDSVVQIGDYAFNFCKKLQSVTIPDSVTQIGVGAFVDCLNLTNLTIPNSVEQIGINAFKNVPHVTYTGTASGSPWGAVKMN